MNFKPLNNDGVPTREPAVTGPSAIYIAGVSSLETAAAEMEEIAAANPRLRNPASDTPTNTMRLE